MFRKYPYWGWLLLTVLGWAGLAGWAWLEKQELKPAALVTAVSEDLIQRSSAFNALRSREDLFSHMYEGLLTDHEVSLLSDQPFFIYGFNRDTLVYWNSNAVVTACNQPAAEVFTLFEQNGIYLKQCLSLDSSRTIVVLYPVVYHYPLENEYLRSGFAASSSVPLDTRVVSLAGPDRYPVINAEGEHLFYLEFDIDTLPGWIPSTAMLVCMVLVLIISISWISLLAVHLARRHGGLMGVATVAAAILIFRSAVFFFGLPFHLDELLLFSPRLYASSMFLPSLGHLILDLFGILWLTVMFNSWSPLTHNHSIRHRTKRLFAIVVYLALLAVAAFGSADLVSNLVNNSKISFDVSNFYSISARTVAGLFAVSLLACVTTLLIFLIYGRLRKLVLKPWHRYLLLAAVCLLVLLPEVPEVPPYQIWAVVWLVLLAGLLDLIAYNRGAGLFAPRMIFLAAFIAVFATMAVNHFTLRKERQERQRFARQAIKQPDRVLEFLFSDLTLLISEDELVRGYLDSPLADTRMLVDRHLSSSYLQGPLNRYVSTVFLFDEAGKPLFNTDTTSYNRLAEVADNGTSVSDYLFYLHQPSQSRFYLATIPVKDDTGELKGYVFIDISRSNTLRTSVYPELLEPGRTEELTPSREFSYAVYQDRMLVTQTFDYPFPAYLADTVDADGFRKIISEDYTARYYQVNGTTTVVIVEAYNPVLRLITLCSYILGTLILFAVVTFLFRIYFHYLHGRGPAITLLHLTLRRRIHLAMLGVVFISFVVIGAVTIWFFIARYEQSNRARIKSGLQMVDRSLQQFLKNERVRQDAFHFGKATQTSVFRNWLSDLASSQAIDINIYDVYGSLTATSQEAIYNKAILARIMDPEGYYALTTARQPQLIQDERIGKLEYLSGYTPVRNEAGFTIGYVNIPFFASERELNYQISSILVALINLYALIFLLSSMLAVFITGWLTGALQIIIDRFEQFSLHGENQPLQWPYNDEIGQLVREYNRMVRKLEENAALLAQSERESAWREMAQQVAHEIKNPLTPMKLNLQYLQQALKNHHPQLEQLTGTVAESLLEQIDNLTHIASAFSDFARMPVAKPEALELNELLHKAVELHQNNSAVQVSFTGTREKVLVTSDKSQLLRVFNNLIQNAIQAIPEDREGWVRVNLQVDEHQTLITIRDNGSGISKEAIGKIFSPYFTTKGSGTGLGLAMTRKIVEFWKGKIWFETEEGSGTEFFIRLPLPSEDKPT